jgi:uncharacterized membrane protein YeaQ/YmgE (transglycosylase-associated protein family)
MYVSGENLAVVFVVVAIAAWLTGQIAPGAGLAILGDLLIGIAGGFSGMWLLPRLNVHLGSGTTATTINAAIGAALLLLAIGIWRGAARRDPNWGRYRFLIVDAVAAALIRSTHAIARQDDAADIK